MKNKNITFIGGGNMARNIVLGLIANGYSPRQINVTNRTTEKLIYFKETVQVNISTDNREMAAKADILILAIKPQQMQMVCAELKAIINEKKPLIISVAVGITATMLAKWLGEHLAIICAMPNTPCALQVGATGLYANARVDAAQKSMAENIFSAVGIVVWAEAEAQMNLIAAVSGSGPAYFFLLMEAFQEAATQLGLPATLSQQLVLQTIVGASRMAAETQQTVTQLRRSVTSSGGTTEQAIKVFEERGVREMFEKALSAAVKRATEITKTLDS